MRPDLFADGVKRFACGIGKKVLLANNIGLLWEAASAQAAPTVLTAWLGVIAYGFQIYFDFSGYSDMAIGLGRMLGFRFWKTSTIRFLPTVLPISGGAGISPWGHGSGIMSISRWGGNKGGLAKQLSNIAIVWLLTGFWHRGKLELCPMGRVFRNTAGAGKAVSIALAQKAARRIAAYLRAGAGNDQLDTLCVYGYRRRLCVVQAMLSGILFDSGSLYLLLTYGPMLVICALAATPLGKRFYEKLELPFGTAGADRG